MTFTLLRLVCILKYCFIITVDIICLPHCKAYAISFLSCHYTKTIHCLMHSFAASLYTVILVREHVCYNSGYGPSFDLPLFIRTWYLHLLYISIFYVVFTAILTVITLRYVGVGFLVAPRDVQLSVGFSVSDIKYAFLCLFWVGT